MLFTSRFQCFCASSAMSCVRIIRAAWRPSVECSTAGVNVVLAIDPAVSSERLAYNLFHEHGVRVFRAAPVQAQCSCSRENVENMLRSFSVQDRDDMVENGKITVTCEFCSSTYVFAPDELAASSPGVSAGVGH